MTETGAPSAPESTPDLASRALEYLFLILAVGLPLVWFREQVDPAGLPRVLVVQLCTIPATMLFVVRRSWYGLPKGLARPLGLFTLVAGCSFIWSRDHLSALFQFAHWLVWLQVFLAGLLLAQNPRFLLRLPWAALLGGSLIALLGLVQTYQHEVPPFIQIFPPSATFLNKNVAAQYLLGVLPPCCMLLLAHRDGTRGWLPPVLGGLMLFYHIMASSRTAWLASLVTCAVLATYVFCFPKLRRALGGLPRRRSFARLLLCLVVVWILVPPREHRGVGSRLAMEEEMVSLARFGDLGEGKINTARVRIAMYLNVLALIAEHPLGGVGLDNFPIYYPRYHQRFMETPTYTIATLPAKLHNDLLQVVVELGLVGGLLFTYVLWLILKAAHYNLMAEDDERKRFARLGLLGGFVALLVMSGGSFPLRMPTSAFWFWLCAGLLAGAPTPARRGADERLLGWSFATLLPNLALSYVLFRALAAGLLLFLGSLYLARDNGPLAYAATHQAFYKFPTNIKAQDQLITLAVNVDRDRCHALALVDDFLARSPYHPNGHYRRAMVLKDLGWVKEAFDALARAEHFGGVTDDSACLRGILHLQGNEIALARGAFEQALAINENHEQARAALRRLP